METNVQEQKYDHLPLGVSGLGGWLILVQIGLYLTMILLTVQLFQHSLPAFRSDTWEVLTSLTSQYYHPLWEPVLIFEAIYNVLFLFFCIFILINFYGKKSTLPRLMIIFYSVSLIIGVIDYLLVIQIPLASELEDGSSLRDIVKSVITCAIWIPYFMKSERVHNTFIR